MLDILQSERTDSDMKNFLELRLEALTREWSPEYEVVGKEAVGVDGGQIYVIKVVDGSGRIMLRDTYPLNGRESPSTSSV